MNSTGVLSNKWCMVHDGVKVICKCCLEEQETVSMHTIELFETEQEMQDRIVELGLEDIVVEEGGLEWEN